MVDSLPARLLIGTVLGVLSGLGVGGGSLLVLWLTVISGVPAEAARAVNLLFFLPAAMISLWFRRKQGLLRLRPLIPAIVSGCVSSMIFSWAATAIDTNLLKKGFGILLILTGIRELRFPGKQKDPQSG